MASHLLVLGLLIATCSLGLASDPSPLQDLCVADHTVPVMMNGFACKDPKAVQADDFFFSGLNVPANTSNPNGSRAIPVTVSQIPGLNTQGISLARVDFAPRGVSPPHTHPRATEIVTVIEGTIEAGFVTSFPENRLITKILQKGDVFVFPANLVHYQRNAGQGAAVALVALNSQNPGLIFVGDTLFASKPAIADDILAKSFRTDVKTIRGIKSRF